MSQCWCFYCDHAVLVNDGLEGDCFQTGISLCIHWRVSVELKLDLLLAALHTQSYVGRSRSHVQL